MSHSQNICMAALLASLALSTCPASANWQFTRWGMTPAQVATASKGTVSESSGEPGNHIEGYEVGDVGRYVSGAYHFQSVFYFQQDGLDLVNLALDGGGYDACLALKHDLEGIYGKPYDTIDSLELLGATWQDKNTNNFFSITIIGSDASATCSLEYKPLATESAKGL